MFERLIQKLIKTHQIFEKRDKKDRDVRTAR